MLVMRVSLAVAMVVPVRRKRRRGTHRDEQGSGKEFLHGLNVALAAHAD
jgi:hypothetical protein